MKRKNPVNKINISPQPEYPMRINKFLAKKGYSTRRGADELISDGKVFINGKQAKLGDKIFQNDKVEVKNQRNTKQYVYYAFHKPRGVITHSPQNDEEDIKTSISKNRKFENLFPVGRLDKDSSGLMILTNDGRITDRLLNPEYIHDKEYIVKTENKLRDSFKEHMEKGVKIEDYTTKPCTVRIINDNTFSIILTEGKKHQIRRMVSAMHNEVREIKRVRILNILLGNMKPGEIRQVTGSELKTFLGKIKLSD